MAKSDKKNSAYKVVADNRRARHDYLIEEVVEAGLMLTGTEVKSLRSGKASLAEAYASDEGGEIYLLNCNIPEYDAGNRNNHAPKRPRKLLLKKREIAKMIGAVQRKGMTLIPLKLYFNDKGIAKLEVAFAKGKKLHDKRQSDKDRSWSRDKARLMREKG